MCGAAAVCYCTCSMVVSLGQDTIIVAFTWRYSSNTLLTDVCSLEYSYQALTEFPWLIGLQIANEPPPLRETPPDCGSLTAEVIKAGLQKDPLKRSSATDLREKTDRALREGKSALHLAWWWFQQWVYRQLRVCYFAFIWYGMLFLVTISWPHWV